MIRIRKGVGSGSALPITGRRDNAQLAVGAKMSATVCRGTFEQAFSLSVLTGTVSRA